MSEQKEEHGHENHEDELEQDEKQDTETIDCDVKDYERLQRARKRQRTTVLHHQSGKPECRVMIYNVAKKGNIGTIIRSAVAFGASQIGVVGAKKAQTFGCQGTNKFLPVVIYEDLAACVDDLRKNNFKIYGVEISAESKDISSFQFDGNSAFFMGNEGSGLNSKIIEICDQLLYIPQYGHGTASLNVSTATAIILHHFARWAQYTPTVVVGQKFIVDDSKRIKHEAPAASETA
jgi:tRNA G18 (ribose-2'-O)-methylase SpoU